MSQDDIPDREIVIERVFDAPRKLVWDVWTEPKHITQWWGPRGYSARVPLLDFKPGGKWQYIMVAPDGAEFPIQGVFLEVVPLEKIVTTDEFGEGTPEEMKSALPKGIVVTATFADEGRKTKLTLRIVHATPEEKAKHAAMGVVAGWNSSFECMDEHLAKFGASIGTKMKSKIFVNLPVKDLKRSMDFFAAVGFTFNSQFTDETAACMVVTDDIFAMLLTEPKFKEFTPKAICDATKATEVLIALSCESRARVEELVGKAVAAGGSTYAEPKDYGFMYQHGIQDPDGHIWELFYMDESAIPKS